MDKTPRDLFDLIPSFGIPGMNTLVTAGLCLAIAALLIFLSKKIGEMFGGVVGKLGPILGFGTIFALICMYFANK